MITPLSLRCFGVIRLKIVLFGLMAFAVARADIAPTITRAPEGGAKSAGMTATLTVEASGTTPLTYEWKKDGAPIGGVNQPSLLLANLTPAHAGSYTVTVSNAAGSATSAPAVVSVSTAPVLSSTNLGTAVTAGSSGFDDVRFYVYAYGSNLRFEWSRTQNANVETGWDSTGKGFYSILTINNARYSDQGYVTARVSNSEGSIDLPTSTLTVMGQTAAAPTISRDLSDQAFPLGQSATLSVAVAGTYPMQFQWYKNGEPIAGGTESAFQAGTATTYSYTFPSVQTGDAGSYRLTLTNPFGTTTSATAVVQATTPPVALTVDLDDRHGVLGQSITLEIAASGVGTLTYQWYKNGAAIAGATTPRYAITSLQPTDAGTYTVTVSNGYATVTSRASVLSYALPSPVATQVAFVGNRVALMPPDLPPGTVHWQLSTDAGATWTDLADGAVYSGTTTATLKLFPVAATMSGYRYRYQYTSGGQTSTSESATLLVLPASGLATPVGLAVNDSGTLYVADASAQTVWKIGTDLQPSVLAGGIGLLGAVDATGTAARFNEPSGLTLNADQSLLVTDSGNSTIRKITPDGVVTTFAGLAGATGSVEGAGSVARFNTPTGITRDATGNSYVSDQMNHLVLILSPLAVSGSMAGKAGIAGAIDSLGSAATFNQPTGIAIDASGNLFVADRNNHLIRKIAPNGQVTTVAGTPGTAGSVDGPVAQARFNLPSAVAVDPAGNLFVADTGNSTIRCISQGVVTTIAGQPSVAGLMDGFGPYTAFNAPEGLAWDAAGSLLVADTGNFAIRKIKPDGNVVTLPLGGGAPRITSQPAGANVSPGTSVSFRVVVQGTSPVTYQWRKDGTTIAGATSESFSISAATAADAGNYTVVATNAFGSTTSSAATLTVAAPVPPPSTPDAGNGGGGAPSLAFVGLLVLLTAIRTRQPKH